MFLRKKKLTRNKELSRIFGQMADCYRYLGPDQRFRANAYRNASKALSNMSEPVESLADDIQQLIYLKDIGESIAEKIIEYLQTGRIKKLEELKSKVPFALFDLLEADGIGPATLHFIHDELHVNTKEELTDLLEKENAAALKNISVKKIETLRKILKMPLTKKRVPFSNAKSAANQLSGMISKLQGVHQCYVAGSIRRKKEIVGDIDIVLTADEKYWKKIVDQLVKFPQVNKVLAAGKTKASIILKNGMQADIRVVHDDELGAALLYFTGSREHTLRLRTLAKKKGWKMNEYGVFDEKTGRRLAGDTEDGIYSLFGMNFIPPEKRIT